MKDTIQNLILSKCPNYDFDRYRFKSGDIVRLYCGALVIVKESAIDYATCYVCKRSLIHRETREERISYDELPYFKKDEFVPEKYKITKSLKWKVGDIVKDVRTDMVIYLYADAGHQRFYGYVLETDVDYYRNTCVYLDNPHKDFITENSYYAT